MRVNLKIQRGMIIMGIISTEFCRIRSEEVMYPLDGTYIEVDIKERSKALLEIERHEGSLTVDIHGEWADYYFVSYPVNTWCDVLGAFTEFEKEIDLNLGLVDEITKEPTMTNLINLIDYSDDEGEICKGFKDCFYELDYNHKQFSCSNPTTPAIVESNVIVHIYDEQTGDLYSDDIETLKEFYNPVDIPNPNCYVTVFLDKKTKELFQDSKYSLSYAINSFAENVIKKDSIKKFVDTPKINPVDIRKTPEYRRFKNKVLSRDKKCDVCKDTDDLEVHHYFPVAEYPELATNEDNGVVLCKHCHKKYHSSKKYGYKKVNPRTYMEFKKRFEVLE